MHARVFTQADLVSTSTAVYILNRLYVVYLFNDTLRNIVIKLSATSIEQRLDISPRASPGARKLDYKMSDFVT